MQRGLIAEFVDSAKLNWAHIAIAQLMANGWIDRARTKTGDEADRLFEAAEEKYRQALDIKPDYHEALNNWGSILGGRARTKTGDEADRLFAAAKEKCQQALDIKPDYHEARNNLGAMLLYQVPTKSNDEQANVINKAITKLKVAEESDLKTPLYNLACAYALLGDSESVKRYLNEAKQYGILPDRAHLNADTDLDSVRDFEWFEEFLVNT